MGKKRIGNTTDSPRDTTKIQELNQRYREEIDEYKRHAEARRNLRKFKQEGLLECWQKANEYFEVCERRKKPYTMAGMLMAIGVSQRTWGRWLSGEYDYITEEYLQKHDLEEIEDIDGVPCHDGVALISFSEFAEWVRLKIQEQLEENLYTNRGNPAGSIFSLKHNYKWREDDAPGTVNQTLVIANPEQVKKAMAMLKE